jgi:hypothetical protein
VEKVDLNLLLLLLLIPELEILVFTFYEIDKYGEETVGDETGGGNV